jgi:hypothetical protein
VRKTRQPRRRIQAKRQQPFFAQSLQPNPFIPRSPLPYAYALGTWEAISFNQRGRIGASPYTSVFYLLCDHFFRIHHLRLPSFFVPLSPSAPDTPRWRLAEPVSARCPRIVIHLHPTLPGQRIFLISSISLKAEISSDIDQSDTTYS